jgi:2-amino-4-hydroxy-6-hydroxymethyldihydropteridine diphosphokinase
VIFIGLGSNLASEAGPPATTIESALAQFTLYGITVVERSPFYESEPVPRSDQPWFVNAVARVETALSPDDLLMRLHAIEHSFGRVRRERNEARTLDLDLLDYDGLIRSGERLVLPHPRLHERAFVLKPLLDLDPSWRDPRSDRTAVELLTALPAVTRAVVRRLGDSVA